MTQPTTDDLQRLLAEEPFVRSLAQSLVADPDDVVQQTWLQALQQSGGRGIEQPRSWLRRIVYNVAANLRRSDRRRTARERAVAVRDLVPSSAELMEREERRRSLVAAIDKLPSSLRTVLFLRYFEGLPPRRIAADLGLPVTTVWTQLRRGLELLRQRLDSKHGGDRRAWLAPLLSSGVPPAGAPVLPGAPVHAVRPLPIAPVLWTGVIAMTTKTKIVAAAAVLLALAGAFVFWPDGTASSERSPAEPTEGPTLTGGAEAARKEQAKAPEVDTSRREQLTAPTPAVAEKTGKLVVRVRYGDDGQPAPGVAMMVRHPGGDYRVDTWRVRTNEAGEATFTGLPPGRLYVESDRATMGKRSEIQAGKTTELDYQLKVGLRITGIVVNGSDTPIHGALVEVAPLARSDFDAQVLATTSADEQGRFHAVGIPPGKQPVVARAAEFAPWQGKCDVVAHATATLRITLTDGATLRGIVRDGAGSVVRGAEVRIGNWGEFAHYRTRTVADGTFAFRGLPTGGVEVVAKHDEFGRATTRVLTAAGATADCELKLSRGVELIGRVIDEAGSPVESVYLQVSGPPPEGGRYWGAHVRTDAEGRFAVANCPEGAVLTVSVRGRNIQNLRLTDVDPKAGRLELRVHRTLPPSAHILGRVVGPDGKPVPNATVGVYAKEELDSPGLHSTGEDGEFKFGPLVPGSWRVDVSGTAYPAFTTQTRRLDPGSTWELGAIRLVRGGTAVAKIHGKDAAKVRLRVVDVDETLSLYVPSGTGPRRTNPLVPGDYRLLVSGEGTAAQAVPFSISASEETKLEVRLESGSSQKLEFTLPPGATLKTSIRLRVLQKGKLVQRHRTSVRKNAPVPTEVWLAPGDYKVTATSGDLRGSATFTVGRDAAAPVRIELR